MRNEEECVCSVSFKFRCSILISGKIIKEMPGSVASGTPYIGSAIRQRMEICDLLNYPFCFLFEYSFISI